jgi:histidine ammonia-lyase
MGMNTALKNFKIIDNAYGILGIEFMAAAQALDLREKYETPYKYGSGTIKAREVIRRYVDYLDLDRPLFPDHNQMKSLVRSNEILEEVEVVAGSLD